MQAVLRQAALEFVDVDAETFLRMVRHRTSSDAAKGGVRSQYEAQLARGDSSVQVLGLTACGTLVGAVSVGLVDLRLKPDTVGGRIDIVVTEPHCRGLGVGGVLVAAAIQRLITDHGPRLRHLSTIAVHPAIAHMVENLEFIRVPTGDVPLYARDVEEATIAALSKRASTLLSSSLRSLRLRCVDCRRKQWSEPWCLPSPTRRNV